jgi:uncharacterized protein YndB with AHSA1/START domain
MKKLEFKININASPKKVWETMLDAETYKEWAKAAWPGSYYEGKWNEGENLKFLSPGQGGTLATLVKHKPYDFTLAKHIAVIGKDGSEDRESEVAKGWVGTTESYTFTENKGTTELKVEINTSPAWAEMFNNDWPIALESLKALCEKQN